MLAPHTNLETVKWESRRDVMDMDKAPATQEQRPQADAEGMIPVTPVDAKIFYVLDCPSLHFVDGRLLLSEGDLPGLGVDIYSELIVFQDLNQCPRCAEPFQKCRRIPLPDKYEELTRPTTFHRQRSSQGSQSSSSPAPPVPLSRSFIAPTSYQPTISANKMGVTESPPQQYTDSIAVGSVRLARPLSTSPTSYPEVVPSSPPPWPQSFRSLSSISTDAITKDKDSSSFGRFRWLSSKKFKKPAEIPPLPTPLKFRFSASGLFLLLWSNNSHLITRIELNSNKSTVISTLQIIPESESDRSITLKLVVEGDGWIASILYHKRRFGLLMTHSSGYTYSYQPLPPSLKPKSLAISRDNAYIAIGYGHTVHLFHYNENSRLWIAELPVPGFRLPEEVRFQVANFSPDGQYLIVGTQRYDSHRGNEDDGVFIRVWRCEERPGIGTSIGFCSMPTDNLGITSVFFDPVFNKSFVSGFVDNVYPLFHTSSQNVGSETATKRQSSPSPPTATVISKPTSFKIRDAAQSPDSSDICFLTESNKLYRVSMKTQATELWYDFSKLRGRLDPHDEPAVVGMPIPGLVYLAWKEGTKFWLAKIGEGVSDVDKIDLRWLIDRKEA